jgi:hypothetical protein
MTKSCACKKWECVKASSRQPGGLAAETAFIYFPPVMFSTLEVPRKGSYIYVALADLIVEKPLLQTGRTRVPESYGGAARSLVSSRPGQHPKCVLCGFRRTCRRNCSAGWAIQTVELRDTGVSGGRSKLWGKPTPCYSSVSFVSTPNPHLIISQLHLHARVEEPRTLHDQGEVLYLR